VRRASCGLEAAVHPLSLRARDPACTTSPCRGAAGTGRGSLRGLPLPKRVRLRSHVCLHREKHPVRGMRCGTRPANLALADRHGRDRHDAPPTLRRNWIANDCALLVTLLEGTKRARRKRTRENARSVLPRTCRSADPVNRS
jgi:hypothetical protein